MIRYSFLFISFIVTLISKVDNQCTDATRPLVVTANGEPQYVTSENYPSNYAASSDCAWQITAAVGEKIVINIEDVNIEGGYSSCYDELKVYDGENAAATLLGTLCTRLYGPDNVKNNPDELVTTSNNLYLTLTSDGSAQQSGFKVLYFIRDEANIPDCGSAFVATLTPVTIMSHNVPEVYSPSFSCNYSFTSETENFGVAFDIKLMDVEESDSCVNDYIRVVGVSESASNVVWTGCTRGDVYDIDVVEASAPTVEFQFMTDSDATTVYLGYMFTFYEVFKGINLTYPTNGSSVSFDSGISEDITSDTQLDNGAGYVDVTATGSLQLAAMELLSNGSYIAATQLDFAAPVGSIYNMVASATGFDYETSTSHTFIITAVDTTDVPLVTYSVTFTVSVTDVDDVAPVFVNLPSNATVYRSEKTGYSVFTVNSTDADVTADFQNMTYAIMSGDDRYSMFSINSSNGEVTLALDVSSTIPLTFTDFTLTIAAYSGDTTSKLVTTSTFDVYVPPDSPPVCTSTSVSGDLLDSYNDQAGKVITYATSWNCTDEYAITYTLGTVTPSLTTTLFAIDSTTSAMTLSRTFAISEVPNRQFVVEIIATDSLDQTTTVTVSMNVTALSCSPNPRPIYPRMDDEVGSTILSDFQCTASTGLTYVLTQFPTGIFSVEGDVNETARIVLLSPVYKLRFYSLKVAISDGIDTVDLEFRVTVRMKRCGISEGVSHRGLQLWTILICVMCLFHNYGT